MKIVHQIRDNDCVNILFNFFQDECHRLLGSIEYLNVHLMHLVVAVNNILLKFNYLILKASYVFIETADMV